MPLNSTLRGRLLLLLLAAILPMLGLALYHNAQHRGDALAELDKDIRAALHGTLLQHEGFVEHTRQLLRIMANADDTRRLASAECSGLAARLLDTQAMYVNLGAADAQGQLVCGARPHIRGRSVAQEAWFADAMRRDGLTAGQLRVSLVTGLPTITYGHPVYDGRGARRGVVYASLDLKRLGGLLAAAQLPEGWAAVVFDREGRILARHPDGSKLTGQAFPETELVRRAGTRPGRDTVTIRDLDGIERRYAYAPLPGSAERMFLALGGEPERVTAPADTDLHAQVGLSAAVAAASLLFVWFGIRSSLLRWSERLREAARRFGAGEKDVRFDGHSELDELAEIGAAFDRMADEVRAREAAAAAAEEQLRLAASVFESSRDAILVTDADGWIRAVNPAFGRITGYGAEQVIGKPASLLKSGRHEPAFYQAMWESIRRAGTWEGEIWNRRKDGSLYPARLSITTVRGAGGAVSHYIGISTDITGPKRAEEHIRQLAYYDELTGLPNRALLAERAGLALAIAEREGREAALLCVGIDRFKTINDSLGHAVGDFFLQALAGRIRDALREADTVARIGGDVFAIVLADTDAAGAAHAAEKLLAVAAQPHRIGTRQLSATVSIGLAVFPADAAAFDLLLQHAETAMFRAKERGRNCYRYFKPEMNAAAVARLTMESDLRRALDRGEFVLHYQPQVRIADGRLAGLEALVRWHDPEAGLVMPGKFIPVAEASGLIEPLGAWILEEACRQAKAWQDAGLPAAPVAVNLSAQQFRRGGLRETVRHALEKSGLAPRYLELELTESMMMEDSARTLATLEELKALGVSLAIDDFGTGYSNLGYLKRFPIDKLKIDQSFVRDIHANPDDLAIAAAVIGMGHSLRLAVIAEGVENAEQLAALAREGCDQAQGYHFGRPMPAQEAARLLEAARSPAV